MQGALDLGHYLSNFDSKDKIAMEDIELVEGKATGSRVKEILLRKEYDMSMEISNHCKHYSKN